MRNNIARIKAIEQKNKQRILKDFPDIDERSGIYILTRKLAYIGQSKNLLQRLAGHLNGYEYIDLSLKKRGLYGDENPEGWKISKHYVPVGELDDAETQLIKDFQENGYYLYNKQSGGQGKGKVKIAEYKPAKGYRDGLKQGYKNAQREVAKLFKHIEIECDKSKKLAERALEKFEQFLEGGQSNG